MKRITWYTNAGVQLACTLEGYPLEELARDIKSEALELWRFDDGTLCVLEHQGETLYVWAIAGEDARRWAERIVLEANKRGCSYIGFRTRRPGLPRMLAHLKPLRVGCIGDTHSEYRIGVAA
jgi:hypothetical protein